MLNLFVYGTLMFPEVSAIVLGRAATMQPAVLEGYERRALVMEVFPSIKVSPRHRVKGMIVRDLSGSDFERLDFFEATFYEREFVNVYVDGSRAPVFVYVDVRLNPPFTADDWDARAFQQTHLEVYRRKTQERMRQFPMPIHQ